MPRPTRLPGILLFLASLTGCAAEPIPAPTTPIVLQPSITEVPRPRPVIKQSMTAVWAFDGNGTCRATATSSGPTLELTADRTTAVIALRYQAADAPRGAVPLRLSGPAGSWSLAARAVGRVVRVSRAVDEDAASRVLVLLSGGTLMAGRAGGLQLPNSGEAGRAWFECVRCQLLP